MSARFTESATRLAGLSAALAGWRPEEFWRATPAELAAVLGAFDADEAGAAGRDELKRLTEMYPDG